MDKEVQEFLDYWKERNVKLPNPSHYPQVFEFYVKLYFHYTGRSSSVGRATDL